MLWIVRRLVLMPQLALRVKRRFARVAVREFEKPILLNVRVKALIYVGIGAANVHGGEATSTAPIKNVNTWRCLAHLRIDGGVIETQQTG